MGCRMEIYTDEDFAKKVISMASEFNIDAQVIGRVEASEKKELIIEADGEKLVF
jgi:phosphoribosylformylglycinamidine cyclo-ligase